MAQIKATILTGFLGSGKTTFLNHIMAERPNERIAIIINEYGEVGIDGQLVIETSEEMIELNNGCICCTVRDDLISALRQLLELEKKFDRIIIETSGLADPAPVIQSFMLDDTLSRDIKLDAIITVVDARHLEYQIHQDEAVEQISFADVILLNKIDLVDNKKILEARECISRLNPLARVIQTKECSVSMGQVLDIGAFDLKNILAIDPEILSEHDHEHDQSISCIALKQEKGLDSTLFSKWLNGLVQEQGKDILRIKGVVNFANEARRYVFHAVHMILEGRPGKPWGGDKRVTEIVFIGRNLNHLELQNGLESCIFAPVS
ncbi:CobW family GTP-binding protein [Acetobacter orientalis]|uniref:CobW family GTP-binding protein n=1 Tax=Acetobacter orientalis TaxID=146474 RepID=UPI0039E7F77E